jgi:acyl transferase domain-containing protein/acyl carrier protein
MLNKQFCLSLNNPFVRDHRVYGQHLLPGLAYIDLIYQLFQNNYYSYSELELRNLSIYNPLIVGQEYDVMLSIQCTEMKPDQWHILVEGQELRNGTLAPDMKRYITAEMHKQEPVFFNEVLDLDQMMQSVQRSFELGDMYDRYRNRELIHSGFMKAEGKIYEVDKAAVIDISLGQAALPSSADFMFHPALIDGSGIGAGALISSLDKEKELLFLPLHYESFRASALLQKRCVTRIQLSSIEQKNELLTFSLEFFDEYGKKVAELKNFINKLVREVELINPDRNKTSQSPQAAQSLKPAKTFFNTSVSGSDNTASYNEAEALLQQLLAERLKKPVDQIQLNAGYYEMGLDSSGLLELVQAIETKVNSALPPTLLFEYTTIAELAAYLSKKYASQFSRSSRAAQVAEQKQTASNQVVADTYVFYEHEAFLQDHLVFGQPALMGVVHPCLVLETYLQNQPEAFPVELKNTKFIGGPVTLKETETVQVQVQFAEGQDKTSFKTVHHVTDPNNCKPCCQGDIGTPTVAPEKIDLEAMLSQAKPLDKLALNKVYHSIKDFTIGPMLRIIDAAYVTNDSTLISKVNLAGKLKKGNVEQFSFDPLLLVACYHFYHKDYERDKQKDNIFVPLMIESLTVYRPMLDIAYVLTKIRFIKADYISFDAKIVTEEGELIAELINASVKEVLNPSLLSNASFNIPLAKSNLVTTAKVEEENTEAWDIAIIGLAGRYPQSYDVEAFWENIRDGKDCVTEIPKERWDWQDFYSEDRTKAGHIYSKWGGFIEDVDRFDPLFFNISPREANIIDPQERLFLQHCWKALEDAGYTREKLQDTDDSCIAGKVGVYVGIMSQEYPLYAAESTIRGQRCGLAAGIASIANRVSYFFDFRGPSMAIDTMCSGSPTAIYLACQALKEKQINVGLAGGVNVTIHPNKYLMLSQSQFISSKGHCESFGEGGDGYIPGEGVGVLVLKRLADAKRDRDNVYAVIKGAAINHGGRSSGYTVPNRKAQSNVIVNALAEAKIDPRTISYVEGHGTGTSLGDPIEVAGLTTAFAHETQEKQFCWIGSVKSNIGHCESAAGVASVTKVLLQMRHGKIVPSLHSKILNPNIDFSSTPFSVNQELREWKRPVVFGKEYPRRAGISCFGAGGSNSHLIVEEYIPEACASPELGITPQNPAIIVLSAKNEERLREQAQQLLAAIHKRQWSDDCLADMAYTLQVGREAMEERMAVLVASIKELEEKLTGFVTGQDGIEDLFRGQVKHNKETLNVFAGDEDMAKTLDAWINKRKYAKLLYLWVKGLDFDWEILYGEVKPHRISLPTYPFARECYWVPEFKSQSGESNLTLIPDKDVTIAENSLIQRNICFSKKRWEQCSAASTRTLHRTVAILTTLETRELALQLAQCFVKSRILDVHDLELQLRQSEEDWKMYDGCVDLIGCGKQKDGIQSWLTWLQQLIEHGHREGLMLLCVTKGLESYQNAAVNLSGASRVGLYRMLQSEYGHLQSRHMDTDITVDDETLAQQIAFEFLVNSEDSEVCYRNGERYRSFLQAEQAEDEKKSTPVFSPEQVLLITGGTRGIGYLCARHLVTHYGVKRLALAGRETMPLREQWYKYSGQNSSIAQKIAAIQALEALGAQVQVLSLSLTDEHAVQESLEEIKNTLGPIGGVIHCAGLADYENPAFIRKSLAGIQRVLDPKVTGLEIIFQNLKDEPLQFFVLFSSVSAIIPALASGQSDYAMANANMDYFAAANSHDCPIVSIEWPSWKETGMGEVKSRVYEQTGLFSLTDSEGLQLLDYILSSKIGPVVLPAVINPELWQPKQLMRRKLGETSSGSMQSRSSLPNELATSDTLVIATQTWLTELFSQELQIKPSQLDKDTPFQDYGVDSVLLAQLLRRINQLLAGDLDPSILFEHPTVKSLAAWLVNKHAASLLQVLGLSVSLPSPTAVQGSLQNLATSVSEKQTSLRTLGKNTVQGAKPSEIAVIGLSCRFPGANSPEEYWQLLAEGRSVVRSVPEERWGYANRYYAGLLDNITYFDPGFFRIPPEDAKAMDPQALLALEESLKLWYHAGYSLQEVKGKRVGVYLGARSQHQPDHASLRQARNPIVTIGQNYLAANVSQFFDLHGPSIVIDTACSSALVGMNLAIQAINSGEVDAALVGGVNLLATDTAHQIFQQRELLSPEPFFHVFDQRAGGIILGEGIGMVLLKTVEQALADGDRIYAVINAVAVNNDGRTAGPATPNIQAQKEVMQTALAKSGKEAGEITYIEANGSGTEVTDLLELKAIQSVYRLANTTAMGLGSIKPNIGHLLCAEGIASLIKVLLMLQHRQFVPFLSGQQPMPHYDMQASPFWFCRKSTEWKNTPQIAAINCFADGGTNVHLILQAWEDLASRQIARHPLPPPELNRYDIRYTGILPLGASPLGLDKGNFAAPNNHRVQDPSSAYLQTAKVTGNRWKNVWGEKIVEGLG